MMIKTVYGKGWREKADSLEKILDGDKSGKIGLAEFRAAEEECVVVFYPITELQGEQDKSVQKKGTTRIQMFLDFKCLESATRV